MRGCMRRSAQELAILFHFPLQISLQLLLQVWVRSLCIQVLHSPDLLLVHDNLWILPMHHNHNMHAGQSVTRSSSRHFTCRDLHFVSFRPLGGGLHTDIDDASNVLELIDLVSRFKFRPLIKWN